MEVVDMNPILYQIAVEFGDLLAEFELLKVVHAAIDEFVAQAAALQATISKDKPELDFDEVSVSPPTEEIRKEPVEVLIEPVTEEIEIPPQPAFHSYIKEASAGFSPGPVQAETDPRPPSPLSVVDIPLNTPLTKEAIIPVSEVMSVPPANPRFIDLTVSERKTSSLSLEGFEEMEYEELKPAVVLSPPHKPVLIEPVTQQPQSPRGFQVKSPSRDEVKPTSNVPALHVVAEPLAKYTEKKTISLVMGAVPPRPAETPKERKAAGESRDEGLKPPILFSTSGMDMREVEYVEVKKGGGSLPQSSARLLSTQMEAAPQGVAPSPAKPHSSLPPLLIEVTNPRTVSTGWFSPSYTLYTIRTLCEAYPSQVDRRFRDIDWMHTQLCSQYKGVSIPPRPEKQMFGTQTAKFVEERRAQIEKYLNMVVGNDTLRNSEVVKVFLTCSLDKLEAEKVRTEKEAEIRGYSGVEDVVDHFVAKIHSKINSTLISPFAPQSKDIIQLESRLTHLHSPTASLTVSFANWVHSEKDLMSTQHEFTVPGDCEFNEVIDEFVAGEGKAIRTTERQGMDLKEEVMRIEGLSNAIATYRDTSESIAQQEALILRKKGKMRATLDEDQSAKYQSEICAASEELGRLTSQLEAIACNISRDSEDFSELRETHILATLVAIAEGQMNRWQRNCAFWRGKQR